MALATGAGLHAILLAVAATIGCGTAAPMPSLPLPPHDVAFTLPTDGGALATIPVPGAKATVLDFFSPTCEPCRRTVPALVARRDALEGKGARLVLVAVLGGGGESTADAARALRSWGVVTPFLVDHDGVSSHEAGVEKLPATLVLGARGAPLWLAPNDASPNDVISALP